MLVGGLITGEFAKVDLTLITDGIEACVETTKGLGFDFSQKDSDLTSILSLNLVRKFLQFFPPQLRDYFIFYNVDASPFLLSINSQLQSLGTLLEFLRKESVNLKVQNHKSTFRGFVIDTNQFVRQEQLQRKQGPDAKHSVGINL